MAKAPRPLRQNFQGHLTTAEPPQPSRAPANLVDKPSAGFKDLNFKVDPEFHQQFKLEATRRGMSMVDLLKKVFFNYLQTNGKD